MKIHENFVRWRLFLNKPGARVMQISPRDHSMHKCVNDNDSEVKTPRF